MATQAQIKALQQRHFRKRYVEQVIIQMIANDPELFKKKIGMAMATNGSDPDRIKEEAKLALKEYIENL